MVTFVIIIRTFVTLPVACPIVSQTKLSYET